MSACALAPLIGLAMAVPVAAAALHSGKRPSLWRIIGKVWEPGLVLACQGVGFAAIGAFLPLFFLSRGWTNAGLEFTCFGGSYVLVRILFGHFPDRLGAVPVALMSMAVEATGQYFLWSASSPTAALVESCLTGMGCSLIYPAMGIEVVRRVAPHLRGTATGGFTAFRRPRLWSHRPRNGFAGGPFRIWRRVPHRGIDCHHRDSRWSSPSREKTRNWYRRGGRSGPKSCARAEYSCGCCFLTGLGLGLLATSLEGPSKQKLALRVVCGAATSCPRWRDKRT